MRSFLRPDSVFTIAPSLLIFTDWLRMSQELLLSWARAADRNSLA